MLAVHTRFTARFSTFVLKLLVFDMFYHFVLSFTRPFSFDGVVFLLLRVLLSALLFIEFIQHIWKCIENQIREGGWVNAEEHLFSFKIFVRIHTIFVWIHIYSHILFAISSSTHINATTNSWNQPAVFLILFRCDIIAFEMWREEGYGGKWTMDEYRWVDISTEEGIHAGEFSNL